MSQATFEELKRKSISLAEAIVENSSLPYALRLSASRELRGWLALGGAPRKTYVASKDIPEATKEDIELFNKLAAYSNDPRPNFDS